MFVLNIHIYVFTHTHTCARSKFFFTFPFSNTFLSTPSPAAYLSTRQCLNKANVATFHTHTHKAKSLLRSPSLLLLLVLSPPHSHERSSFFACIQNNNNNTWASSVCVYVCAYVVLLLVLCLFDSYSYCLALASHSPPAEQ